MHSAVYNVYTECISSNQTHIREASNTATDPRH